MSTKINSIFSAAVEHGASDVHLINGQKPILRIDGVLHAISNMPVLDEKNLEETIFSILNEKEKNKFVQEREFDTSYELPAGERFRVNLFWEKENPALVARLIPAKIPTMEELNTPDIVYALTRIPKGLVIVTGPTGCGKSTSLASMIELINNERSAHIVTLEDPIEFLFTSKKSIIVQRQLGRDMLSFAEALKHVVRQDPNVIMVGEMRDLETIGTTITLAETGHLVLATLHTYSAAQTIDRIIDVFPPAQQNQVRLQLSISLQGIICQQLLPKVDGGRIAAREILINTPAVANLIRENKVSQIKTVIQTSADVGMVTMEQSIKQLYKDGLISEETSAQHISR